MRLERFKRLKAIENSYQHDIAFLQMLPDSTVVQALRTLPRSASQIRQDILALALSGFKKNGFFVEFGATDGVKFSNSYLLEKDFGWQGILGEPARGFHERLQQNRGCHIETNCVWCSSGDSLVFSEPRDGSLSSIADFVNNDHLAKSRKKKRPLMRSGLSRLMIYWKNMMRRNISTISVSTRRAQSLRFCQPLILPAVISA